MQRQKRDFAHWSHMQSQLRAAWNQNKDQMVEWANRMCFQIDACDQLGLGYRADKRAITWPERDANDEIVGIGHRDLRTGRKYMAQTSRRGLIYAPDPKWGGIPSRIDQPILIVEGMTDTLACLSNGIYAIGIPSAKGTAESFKELQLLVRDRTVALCCENDGGIGEFAFLENAERLDGCNAKVYAVRPPSEIKDIHEWFQVEGTDVVRHIEHDILHSKSWSEDRGVVPVCTDLLPSDQPCDIAEQFLR